jgi:hypothetical protein
VRHFRNSLFALVAFLWLPASAHCQLESITGLEFLRCAVEGSNAHSPAKNCCDACVVEKSQYRAEHFTLDAPTPDSLFIFSKPLVMALTSLPAEVSVGILTAAPPLFLQTWQFASRTALPARAPSIAS